MPRSCFSSNRFKLCCNAAAVVPMKDDRGPPEKALPEKEPDQGPARKRPRSCPEETRSCPEQPFRVDFLPQPRLLALRCATDHAECHCLQSILGATKDDGFTWKTWQTCSGRAAAEAMACEMQENFPLYVFRVTAARTCTCVHMHEIGRASCRERV